MLFVYLVCLFRHQFVLNDGKQDRITTNSIFLEKHLDQSKDLDTFRKYGKETIVLKSSVSQKQLPF